MISYNTARAYEAVYVAAHRLRPLLRLVRSDVEAGCRVVVVKGGTPAAWRDLFDSIEHVELAKADREVKERATARDQALLALPSHRRRKRKQIPRWQPGVE